MIDRHEHAKLLDQVSASEFLRDEFGLIVAPATLQKKRCIGGGPRFRRAMRRALYEPNDLRSWAAEQIGPSLGSTSEVTTASA